MEEEEETSVYSGVPKATFLLSFFPNPSRRQKGELISG
jgi:hypothetical protein